MDVLCSCTPQTLIANENILVLVYILYFRYKFSLVYNLLHCCFEITFSYEKFHKEKNSLKQIFKLNRYPIQFIDRNMKQFFQKLHVTKAIQDTINIKQLLIVLLILVAQSFSVRKQLQSCTKPFTILFFKNCFLIQN